VRLVPFQLIEQFRHFELREAQGGRWLLRVNEHAVRATHPVLSLGRHFCTIAFESVCVVVVIRRRVFFFSVPPTECLVELFFVGQAVQAADLALVQRLLLLHISHVHLRFLRTMAFIEVFNGERLEQLSCAVLAIIKLQVSIRRFFSAAFAKLLSTFSKVASDNFAGLLVTLTRDKGRNCLV